MASAFFGSALSISSAVAAALSVAFCRGRGLPGGCVHRSSPDRRAGSTAASRRLFPACRCRRRNRPEPCAGSYPSHRATRLSGRPPPLWPYPSAKCRPDPKAHTAWQPEDASEIACDSRLTAFSGVFWVTYTLASDASASADCGFCLSTASNCASALAVSPRASTAAPTSAVRPHSWIPADKILEFRRRSCVVPLNRVGAPENQARLGDVGVQVENLPGVAGPQPLHRRYRALTEPGRAGPGKTSLPGESRRSTPSRPGVVPLLQVRDAEEVVSQRRPRVRLSGALQLGGGFLRFSCARRILP